MKKALLMAVALGAMATFADSDTYLYWMIGETSGYDFSTARVHAFNGDKHAGYLSLYYSDGTMIGDGSSVSSADALGDQDAGLGMYAALGNLLGNTYSYIIELYNDGGEFLAQSSELTYANARNMGLIYGDNTAIPSGNTWTGSSYAVPEPTSGMLMLVGGILLALRRRRV